MRPFLTVFVPAYNEAGNLPGCVLSVLGQMEALGVPVEILIVDDASGDETGRLADQLAAQDARVRATHHRTNLGIGGAFMTALEQAQGEWLILIPADLAIEPSELRRYLSAAPQADVVVGLRSDLSDYNLARKLVHEINIFLVQRLFHMPLQQFQYISMYRLEVLHNMTIEYWRSAFFLAEILIKARAAGYRLVEVEVLYAPRITGRATGAKIKLVFLTLRDMFRFWVKGWRVSPVDLR